MSTISPIVPYRDLRAAIDFLCDAKAAGAEIVTELRDTDYGSRDYAAKDPDGNTWYFGSYRPGAA